MQVNAENQINVENQASWFIRPIAARIKINFIIKGFSPIPRGWKFALLDLYTFTNAEKLIKFIGPNSIYNADFTF